MSDDLDLSMQVDVFAAMLRHDQKENVDYIEFLATKLTLALPAHTKVERGGGWFSKAKPVEKILVELHDHHFILIRDKTGPIAHKAKIVRGVQLSHKELPLEQWTRELSDQLRVLAEQSAQTREALERFIIGG